VSINSKKLNAAIIQEDVLAGDDPVFVKIALEQEGDICDS